MAGARRYTDEQLGLVRELVGRGWSDSRISRELDSRFGTSTTANSVQMLRRYHGIRSGLTTCDMWGRPVTIPGGTLPLLSERRNALGYWEVKVGWLRIRRRGDMWVRRAVLEWERSHGKPLPDGMRVVHADGDRENDDPSNLVAMTVREFAMVHGSDFAYHDRETLEAALAIARVRLRANDLEGLADPHCPHQRQLRARRESAARRRGADGLGR